MPATRHPLAQNLFRPKQLIRLIRFPGTILFARKHQPFMIEFREEIFPRDRRELRLIRGAVEKHKPNRGKALLIRGNFSRNRLTQCGPLTDFLMSGDSSRQRHRSGTAYVGIRPCLGTWMLRRSILGAQRLRKQFSSAVAVVVVQKIARYVRLLTFRTGLRGITSQKRRG
jgi:hypothetical protein